MENGSLMKVKSIAECSHWSILQYFWPALSDNRYWKPFFCVHFEWLLKTVLTVDLFFLFAKPYVRQKTDLVSDLSLILVDNFFFFSLHFFCKKDTLIMLLKYVFEKVNFKKNQLTKTQAWKNYPACKENGYQKQLQ